MSRSELRRGRGAPDAGASAVEFAVVLPILLLFIFGIIEFGLAFNRTQAFQAAAHEGGRLASVGYAEQVDDEADPLNRMVRGIAGSTVAVEDIVVDADDCAPNAAVGGVETATVEVRLRDQATIDRYGIRIPVIGSYLERALSYSTEVTVRCEGAP